MELSYPNSVVSQMVREPNGEETGILVVEDDPDVRFILKKTLEKMRYEVEAVESGLEGLEAMNTLIATM